MNDQPIAWACSKDLYRITHMLKNKIELHAHPGRDYKPVYADPPKKKWVGLLDEEIMGLACECVDDGTFSMKCAYDFARAIEEKLRKENT